DFSPARVATVALGPNARALEAATTDDGRRTTDPGTTPSSVVGGPSSVVSVPSSVVGGPSSVVADPPVRVLERAPERWLLVTDAPAERFLVFTQAYFPGWEAT